MRITIPKILRALDLAEYAPELVHPDGSPILIWVWVNPPRDLMDRRRRQLDIGRQAVASINAMASGTPDGANDDSLMKRRQIMTDLIACGQLIAGWFAEIWSQHAEVDTHWSTDDVVALGTNATDPALYPWLQSRTLDLIRDHRELEKKRP